MTDDFYVILGCFGLETEGFHMCRGVENVILSVNPCLSDYPKFIQYLESCRLFHKPIFDYNAARSFVFYLNKNFDQGMKPFWPAKKFELYEKFIVNHRHCGIFLRLDTEKSKNDRIEITIKQEKSVEPEENRKLTLIRGRR